tara:strand:- start:3164 stop:3925 length:762 start_codon:yes stop_codon:yes gene_type:complete
MEITFLGTGTSQGVPVIGCNCDVCLSHNPKDKRLRSSVLINVDGNTLVIDTGPDFRQQMLRENVKKLDAVLFTHSHKDHTAGLDDIRSYNFRSKKPMEVFCSNDVLSALKMEFSYIFADFKYPGVPKVNINLIDESIFNFNNISITPIKALHHKLPVHGFRIKDFVYLTDISEISQEEKKKILNADIIVLDSLRKEPHLSHLCLQESIDLIKEVNPKRAYLIHISHLMGLHNEINSEIPSNISLAYDGLKITI